MTPITTCSGCGKTGTLGMATHRTWCEADPAPRFWAKVQKGEGCWIWQGARVTKGYGTIAIRGFQDVTHRVSWTLTNGPIPDGMHVLHRCDTPACVNPAHLFLGTNNENHADKMIKGRHHSVGDENFHAKLTNEQAKEIYARYRRDGSKSNAAELAAEFNSTIPSIHNIGTGRTWWRVTGATPTRRVPLYFSALQAQKDRQ